MTTYRTQSFENEADYCREHGLLPGTKLVGDEGYGPSIFTITALGEEKILGRSQHGGRVLTGEHVLTLSCRDWSIVEAVTSLPAADPSAARYEEGSST